MFSFFVRNFQIRLQNLKFSINFPFFSVIMVLGAGRGPLMTACIEALDSLDVKAKLYAVEKNPNAIVT